MNYWLMKSEPNDYSIENLQQDRQTIWDGVRNYQARNFLREINQNDLVFFYHSNTKTPGIVGLMKVVESNVIDPTQFDPNSKYYDSKATLDRPRWQTVTVKFVQTFPKIITLTQLKAQYNSDRILLVKKGNRLSVMPIIEEVAREILAMSK